MNISDRLSHFVYELKVSVMRSGEHFEAEERIASWAAKVVAMSLN